MFSFEEKYFCLFPYEEICEIILNIEKPKIYQFHTKSTINKSYMQQKSIMDKRINSIN